MRFTSVERCVGSKGGECRCRMRFCAFEMEALRLVLRCEILGECLKQSAETLPYSGMPLWVSTFSGSCHGNPTDFLPASAFLVPEQELK